MAVTNTISTLDALFKTVYGDKIHEVIPDNAKLVKRIKYSDKFGDDFKVPVVLANEGGVTYAGTDEDAFTLQSSTAMTMADATVTPYQMAIRSRIGYNAASRAKKGEKAFAAVMNPVVKSMRESLTHRLEIAMLYGQTGIGTVTSYSNTSATVTVITFTDTSWASGIWVGTENHVVQFVTGAGTTISGSTGKFTVTSVDISNKAVTFTGAAADITALENAVDTSGETVEAYFYGARDGSTLKEFPGFDKIATNTGTLWGINSGTYNLWKGNTYDASGNLSLSTFDKAITASVNKGLNGDTFAVVSPLTWSFLLKEQTDLRRYDGSYSKATAENGSETIVFYSQNGKNEIIPHNCVKEGESFIIPATSCKRLGAVDVSFTSPINNEKIFLELEDTAAIELRGYTNQALFCDSPAKLTKITGITNTSS